MSGYINSQYILNNNFHSKMGKDVNANRPEIKWVFYMHDRIITTRILTG